MKKLFAIVLTASLAAACGSKSSDGGDAAPAPTDNGGTKKPAAEPKKNEGKKPANGKPTAASKPKKPAKPAEEPAALSCEDRWQKYYDVSDVGDFVKYHIVGEMTINGTTTPNESYSKQTVAAKGDGTITFDSVATMNGVDYPTTFTMTKQQFVDNCDKQTDAEHGEESVTVEAGTYDTKWIKTKTEVQGNVTTTKAWNHELASGDVLLVQTDSEGTIPNGTTKSHMELVETNRD